MRISDWSSDVCSSDLISVEAEVDWAVGAATEALGTINLVANVAGGSGVGFGVGPLISVPADEFRKVLDVNLTGTWLVSKAAAQRMVGAEVGGRICHVSSQAGKKGLPLLDRKSVGLGKRGSVRVDLGG